MSSPSVELLSGIGNVLRKLNLDDTVEIAIKEFVDLSDDLESLSHGLSDEIMSRVAEISGRLSDIIESLKGQVDLLTETVVEYKNHIKNLSAEIVSLNGQLAAEKSKLAALYDEINTTYKDIIGKAGSDSIPGDMLEEIKAAWQTSRNEVANAYKKVDDVAKAAGNESERIAELEAELASKADEVTDLYTKNNDLARQVKTKVLKQVENSAKFVDSFTTEYASANFSAQNLEYLADRLEEIYGSSDPRFAGKLRQAAETIKQRADKLIDSAVKTAVEAENAANPAAATEVLQDVTPAAKTAPQPKTVVPEAKPEVKPEVKPQQKPVTLETKTQSKPEPKKQTSKETNTDLEDEELRYKKVRNEKIEEEIRRALEAEAKKKFDESLVGSTFNSINKSLAETAGTSIKNSLAFVFKTVPLFLGKGIAFVVISALALSLNIGVPLAVVGGAGYMAYNYLYDDTEDQAATDAKFKTLINAIFKARESIGTLIYISGSENSQSHAAYMKNLELAITKMVSEYKTPEDYKNFDVILSDLKSNAVFFKAYSAEQLDESSAANLQTAVQANDNLLLLLSDILNVPSQQPKQDAPTRTFDSGTSGQAGGQSGGAKQPVNSGIQKKERSPNDKGIDVLGQKVYLSEYNLPFAVANAAPILIKRVLLSPTGLAFWDPENKHNQGFLKKNGSFADQVVEHILFFMNPRGVDSDWAFGQITSEKKLKHFLRKNMNRVSMKGFKNNMEQNKNKRFLRKNVKSADNSANSDNILLQGTKIAADLSKEYVKYYKDAYKDLDDTYTKDFVSGLKSKKQKLNDKRKYEKLYDVFDQNGFDLIEEAHPKSVEILDSVSSGGIIENQVQQQEKSIEVANSYPTGNFYATYANLNNSLIKIFKNSNDIATISLFEKAMSDIKKINKQ